MKQPKQLEEIWKSHIHVDSLLSVVLDAFAQSHGADSAMLETLACAACGVSSSALEDNPDKPQDIICPNCHSHDVIITEVRLFTFQEPC